MANSPILRNYDPRPIKPVGEHVKKANMKLSIFNSRIPLSSNTDILFNSFTEECQIVEKNLCLTIDDMNHELTDILYAKGFIIDDEVDETGRIFNAFKDCYSNNDVFKLTINPTLNCNFRCWYCYETHHAQSTMSKEVLERVKRCIDWISNKYKAIELAFFGGEPLMQYREIVKPLIEHIQKVSCDNNMQYQVTFTTNGYLMSDEIINDLKHYNVGVSQITLDGGPDSHNKTRISKTGDSYKTIVNNIRRMAAADFPVLLRINVTKDNINGASEIINSFRLFSEQEKSKINVLIQQVWQDVKNDILDEIWALYSQFVKIGIRPWPRRFNFYQACCYGDKRHSAVINHDGKIFKCTAINFDQKQPDGELSADGHIDIEAPFNLRIKKRSENRLCGECRILPVCNGGCSKNVDQANISDYCLHPTEAEKDKVVKDIIREQLYMSELGLSWKD